MSLETLEQCCSLITDGTHYTPKDIGVGVPFLTVKDMSSVGLDLVNCAQISDADFSLAKTGNCAPQPGDVLFSKDGTVGKVHVVTGQKDFAVLSSIAILRPDARRVYPDYLGQILKTESVLSQAIERKTGSAIRRIILSDLKKVRIPLPKMEEQRRIAATLDQAEALRAKRRQALAKLDSLAHSLFVDMFGDPLTNPKGWPLVAIGEMGVVVTGSTPSRARADYFGDAIEWIKSDNINTPHYYLTRASEYLSEFGRSVARTVPPDSILVTCIAGSPSCIGNAAMADREVAFNQQINALIPKRGDPHFIYAELLAAKKRIQEASTNGMKGIVTKSRFEQILLPFPPVALQRDFAKRVSGLRTLKAKSDTALVFVDKLMTSLQNRAFRGEL